MKGAEKHGGEHKGHGGGHKKQKKPEEGLKVDAPLWMMSWADMTTLLMALFVALYSISTLDIVKFQAFLEGIRGIEFSEDADSQSALKAFYEGRTKPVMPAEAEPPRGTGKEPGASDLRKYDEGNYDEGARPRIGPPAASARVLFAEGSAALSAAAEKVLSLAASDLRGYPFKIEVRGHCSAGEPGTARNLSYARAMAVYEFLTAKEGIPGDRIKISVMGTSDRLNLDLSLLERKENRRAEIWESPEYTKGPGPGRP